MSGSRFVRCAFGLLGVALVCQFAGCTSVGGGGREYITYDVDGCKFVNFTYPFLSGLQYGPWSGACEGGYVSGPGYMGVTLSDGTKYERNLFVFMKASKPQEFGIALDNAGEPLGYRQELFGAVKRHHHVFKFLTDTECVAIKDCKIMRDAYFKQASHGQQERLKIMAGRAAAQQQEQIQGNIRRAKESDIEFAKMDQEIKERNRANKQRWLAEEQAEKAASSGASRAMLGGLLQAAGQVAQATGSGKENESGRLTQGMGAVLAGDYAAAQQAVARVEQSGTGNAPVDSRPVPQCASFSASSGGTVASYTEVRNTCDFDISVNWCRSSGPVGSGCGVVLHLPKNTSQRIYDPIKEAFVQAACRYPLHVFAPDGGKWTGSNGGFSCRPI